MSLVVLPQTQHASQTAPDSAAEQLMSLHKYPEPVQVRRPLQLPSINNTPAVGVASNWHFLVITLNALFNVRCTNTNALTTPANLLTDG